MLKTNLKTDSKKQVGFTMIEVLVALFILSIGVTGVAMLQLTALKRNQSTQYQAAATMIAYDLMDKMRRNRTIALAGGYNLNSYSTSSSIPGSIAVGSVAYQDITDMRRALLNDFPANAADITISRPGARRMQVSISWSDSKFSSVVEANSLVVESEL